MSETELDFLRRLEQSLQHLHERVQKGYSGLPEVIAVKREINERIVALLAEKVEGEP